MFVDKKTKVNDEIILGIDPGSTRIGYGVISYKNHLSKPKALGYGYIDLKNQINEGKRLLSLHKDLKRLFRKYKPQVLALENIYFFKNAKTITPVIQSRGVILFTASQANIDTYEYTPLQIKQTISGYGRAEKEFIRKIIQSSLNIRNKINPDDASDALAIALCHIRIEEKC